MKPELEKAVFNLMLAIAKAEADSTENREPAEELGEDDQFDENGRPLYLLCDEIWEILDEAGHGTPVVINKDGQPSEVLIYDRYASQTDNVHFMNRIWEVMADGWLVTVNGTDILDLY